MLHRGAGPLGRLQKCMASIKIRSKVLVEMVSSRVKVLVDEITLRSYSQDLDGTFVSEETSTTLTLEGAPPARTCEWNAGLAARALKGVNMHRPSAQQAAQLLSRGRHPRTIKG